MMSNGALKMPAMAETVPDSVRRRAICGPKAPKYCIIAMPPLTNERLLSYDVGSPDRRTAVAHARQPDVVEEAGRVVDQRVVLVGPHEGLLRRRLAVLEARVGGHVDARDAVVLQADRLGQPGPDVDHVGDDGVPVEIGGALPGGGKGLFVVVRHLLAGVAGVLAGELGDERPDRNHVRLLVPHGRRVAAHPGGVTLLHVQRRRRRLLDGCHRITLRGSSPKHTGSVPGVPGRRLRYHDPSIDATQESRRRMMFGKDSSLPRGFRSRSTWPAARPADRRLSWPTIVRAESCWWPVLGFCYNGTSEASHWCGQASLLQQGSSA